MIKHVKKGKWSPYVVGIFIALLSTGSFFLFENTLGVTITFVKIAAFFHSLLGGSHAHHHHYYQEYLQNSAWIDWQFMLVIGVFLGSYLSRKLSHDKQGPPQVPEIWKNAYGDRPKLRYLSAFLGGIIIMFGARLAGGCTSGHAISGGFQLALSGWLFMIGAFALGIPTALFLYRTKGGKA